MQCSPISLRLSPAVVPISHRFSRGNIFQEGTIAGVAGMKNTISYASLDSILAAQNQEEADSNCHVKMARMINKFGTVVSPTSDSAQAAVRSNSARLTSSPDCPGLGMCAEIMDADDSDVWPITTLTVSALRTQCHASHRL